MNTPRVRIWLFVFLGGAYMALLAFSAQQMPERLATHFDLAGQPNGWLRRSVALWAAAGFGLGMPLFIVGVHWALRFFPVSLVNMPHREYWLSPERRGATQAWLLDHAWWLASLMVLFAFGLQLLTLQANRVSPAHLPGVPMAILTALDLLGLGVWIFAVYRQFGRPPAAMA